MEEFPITYRKLLDALKELSSEQLDMSVTVYDPDTEECIPVYDTVISDVIPELDMDPQPLLVLNKVY
jgi:hypothetical protein